MLTRLLLPATLGAALVSSAVDAQITARRTTAVPRTAPRRAGVTTRTATPTDTTVAPASQLFLPAGTTLAGSTRNRVTARQITLPSNTQINPINTTIPGVTAPQITGPFTFNGRTFFQVQGVGMVPLTSGTTLGAVTGPFLINGQYFFQVGGLGFVPAIVLPTGTPTAINPRSGAPNFADRTASQQTPLSQRAVAPLLTGGFNTGFTPTAGQFSSNFGTTPAVPINPSSPTAALQPGITIDPRLSTGVTGPTGTTGTLATNGTTLAPGVTFVPDPFPGYGGFYGGGYPGVYTTPQPGPIGPSVPSAARAYGGVPIAGLNAPPLGRAMSAYGGYGGARSLRQARREADGPRMATNIGLAPTGDLGVREKVAGERIEMRASEHASSQTYGSAEDPKQISLASYARDLMQDRPMREATVVEPGATQIRVRYVVEGKPVVESYPVNQVFFFRDDNKMETAATAPSLISRGERVLIPERLQSESRTSVATMQRERRSTDSEDYTEERSIAPGATSTDQRMDTASTPVREKVAGYRSQTTTRSRSTVRRRPAK